ncbi:glycosyltransferase family 2 protein [Clostridiaceae bacterium]|nr:glycosyltransferase family 2 protein [Clostridiaceae bacterium]
MPRISVVMPIYNSRKHLRAAVDSVLAQTFQDWELLAINEFGSLDGSAEIIMEYSQKDPRIHFIQNTKLLGLAESLNKGICLAKGEFIARLDADDLAHPKRFQKQVQFMEQYPNVIVCGTYQHHFGPETDWIHMPSTDPKQCRANLLFFCDLCHSTLMLRKQTLLDYDLFYDSSYLAEDYELWTRVIEFGDIANIPEVLGKYRWGQENITQKKLDSLYEESGTIIANSLKRNLGIVLTDQQKQMVRNWKNPVNEIDRDSRGQFFSDLEKLLRTIYEKNKNDLFYDENALLNSIAKKWIEVRYRQPFYTNIQCSTIDDIFKNRSMYYLWKRIKIFWQCNKGINRKIKKIHKKFKEIML